MNHNFVNLFSTLSELTFYKERSKKCRVIIISLAILRGIS